ncbi:MAG TPA: rhomboid family intramembrane serine protease [Verrucomicrobiota bacterium]|jgi:membrane associated rhomboid family serine protease|nr:rhomboid family intramembrane serine protease [Verrucomicrobiota bacterium]
MSVNKNSVLGGFSRAAVFVLFLGVVLLVDTFTGDSLTRRFGIEPRSLAGLDGMLFAPLLHGDFGHYLSNAMPMIVLLGLLFANSNYKPWRSLVIVWLLGGLGTWLLGRPGSTHIGASIVIFGLVTFLLFASLFLRSWRSAIVSSVVLFFYGGIFLNVLPPLLNSSMRENISWEGHLSGAIAGVIAAWRVRVK